MRAPRAFLGVVAACAAVAAVAVAAAPPAGAIIDGPCTATVQGIDVGPLPVDDPSAAIKVEKDDTITYDVASSNVVRSRGFVLSYAGFNFSVDSGSSSRRDTSGDTRAGAVVVDDYAWMGAGLYQVAGTARLGDGSRCSGAVLIDVQGNPLATAAGITGLILTVLGAAGIITGAIRRGGGRQVRDLIDLIELGGFDPGEVAEGGTGPATDGGAQPTATGPETTEPITTTGPETTGTEPATSEAPAAPPPPPGGPGASTPFANETASEPVAETGAGSDGATEPTPPPLPGMEAVTAVGATGKALTEATEQLEGYIGELPITDEQKEKLTETLGVDTIKEKLETVTEVTETIEHFEAMGTETVDTMNRWGVNANGINGLLWLRTMTEATGRLGQKFTDGIVTPVLEPVAEAAGQVGVEVDAEEVAHTLLPVQEVAEEASKALLTAGKNVLGGDNILGQLGQDPVVDEEWRNIRTFD